MSVSNPRITEISVNPSFNNYKGEKSQIAIADFMASAIFKVWWKKGEVKHKGIPTEADFKVFMEAWSEAQKGNDAKLWKKVQSSTFANELTTQGYTQQEVIVWPMFIGDQPPQGIRALLW